MLNAFQLQKKIYQKLRPAFRALKLNPMFKVLKLLRAHGVNLATLDVLEPFGRDGNFHTKDYYPLVHSLDIWELDRQFETALRRNLPRAEVKIVDSFAEIETTPKRYNCVVIDNPSFDFGDHSEHFDFFEKIFRVLRNEAYVIVNVIPSLASLAAKEPTIEITGKQVERRAAFYKTSKPHEVELNSMVPVYAGLCTQHGFKMEWHHFVKRHYVHYLVFKVSR